MNLSEVSKEYELRIGIIKYKILADYLRPVLSAVSNSIADFEIQQTSLESTILGMHCRSSIDQCRFYNSFLLLSVDHPRRATTFYNRPIIVPL